MRSIYFIGIAGSGMLPLAIFARKQGWQISGSDPVLEHKKELAKRLKQEGITCYTNVDESRILRYACIVYSSAITPTHPEHKKASEAREQGKLQLWHRMEFLNFCLRECPHQIAVGGTHGKTSTTAMLAWLLHKCGIEPNLIVGGRPLHLEWATQIGSSYLALYESDEPDASFLQSQADMRLLLNIDSDHLEHYQNISNLYDACAQFVQAAQLSVLDASNLHIVELIKKHPQVITHATFYYILNPATIISNDNENIREHITKQREHYLQKNEIPKLGDSIKLWACFTNESDILHIYQYAKNNNALVNLGYLRLSVPGRHFANNALGALALCLAGQERQRLEFPKSISPSQMMAALNNYPGSERRIEKIGVYNSTTIYDDYAHHPTAIRAVLEAVRGRMNKKAKLHVIFQPHRYTRTAALYKEFAKALQAADALYLLPIYSSGEKEQPNISSKLIAENLPKSKIMACQLLGNDDIKLALQNCHPNDVLIGLGAGNISSLLRTAWKERKQ